jgi:hypothetical protein
MNARTLGLAAVVLLGGGVLAWALFPGKTPSTDPVTIVPPGNTNGTAPVIVIGAPTGDATDLPLPGTGAAIEFTHPSQCRACHADVYAEWEDSFHRVAWTDPHVRELSDNFKDTSCLSCHVPQPIHSGPVGSRVFERNSRFETGVDCLSCHQLPGGGVAARRDVPGAPCRPKAVATLGEAISCNGCHNQHGLVEEWKDLFNKPKPEAGALLTEGRSETCNDCHMPEVERVVGDGTRKGRSHRFPGGHSPEMLRSGMSLAASVDGGKLEVSVTNSNTGHRAPSDSRHRSFNVWVTVTTDGGVRVHDRRHIAEYRLYYRTPQQDDTNLRPGETARSSLALPAGVKGTILVELGYSLSPPDKDARKYTVVHAQTLTF